MKTLLIALLLGFISQAQSQTPLKITYSSSSITIGGAETEYGAVIGQRVSFRMLMQSGVKIDSIIVMDELYTVAFDSLPLFSEKDTLELILSTSWYSDIPDKKEAQVYIWKRNEKLAHGPWPASYSGIVKRTEEYVSIIYYSYKGKTYSQIIRKFDRASQLAAP